MTVPRPAFMNQSRAARRNARPIPPPTTTVNDQEEAVTSSETTNPTVTPPTENLDNSFVFRNVYFPIMEAPDRAETDPIQDASIDDDTYDSTEQTADNS